MHKTVFLFEPSHANWQPISELCEYGAWRMEHMAFFQAAKLRLAV